MYFKIYNTQPLELHLRNHTEKVQTQLTGRNRNMLWAITNTNILRANLKCVQPSEHAQNETQSVSRRTLLKWPRKGARRTRQ